MEIKKLVLGELMANCYLVQVDDSHCVLIDIGDGAAVVERQLTTLHLEPVAILLTHGHFDHVAGVEQIRATYNIPVYIHEADAAMLSDSAENLGDWLSPGTFQKISCHVPVTEGETLSFGKLQFKALHTPGHTLGSLCWQCEDCLFTGDTLFRMSRGRTDFPGGSDAQMLDSLRRLKHLEQEFQVLPGHNESSVLSFEKEHNPSMRGL